MKAITIEDVRAAASASRTEQFVSLFDGIVTVRKTAVAPWAELSTSPVGRNTCLFIERHGGGHDTIDFGYLPTTLDHMKAAARLMVAMTGRGQSDWLRLSPRAVRQIIGY